MCFALVVSKMHHWTKHIADASLLPAVPFATMFYVFAITYSCPVLITKGDSGTSALVILASLLPMFYEHQ